MLYTLPELLAVLIVTCGIALQTVVGIGYGLLAAPLLYLINPAYVPGPVLLVGFGLALMMVIRERNALRWRRVMPAIIARIPGAWCGAALLVALPQYALSLFFGFSVLTAVLLSLWRFNISATPVNLIIGGFFSGVGGTATSVGGPPIALVYQQQDRITARSEIAAFLLIGTPVSLLMLIYKGSLDWHSAQLSLKIVPGLFLGFFLARKIDGKLSTTSAKPLLLIVSAASALFISIKGLLGWLAL
ncbi:sulfite exporter TauE/SafE family protein [Amphritea sp. 2_MG-2023]|uniref:sulfite exporter TauE/SafE family protein n=1 Tax=Amphritea TaxID=515417 RepID=UPI001C064AE6|nr:MULTISPECIES: sulfite exporter TauE/SafE family protein [Amphritea]MBU2965040.1 sulfite exporter TauE/SafE family protein [Amphritea atlantica]MDO6418825.1 sulfite exporter TauE/SafE family protein [Amphritea sp. 2_MG-2023]